MRICIWFLLILGLFFAISTSAVTDTKKDISVIFGEWVVLEKIVVSITGMASNPDLIVGQSISYNQSFVTFGQYRLEDPYYEVEHLAPNDLLLEYRASAEVLEIDDNPVMIIWIMQDPSTGMLWKQAPSMVIVKSQDDLIISDGGAFYRVVRVN